MTPRARSAPRTTIPPLDELVDTHKAVALTGHTRHHLYRLTAEGRLPVFKIGSRNRYWVRDLEALVVRKAAS